MSSPSRPLSYPTTPLTLFWYPVPDTDLVMISLIRYYIVSPYVCRSSPTPPTSGETETDRCDVATCELKLVLFRANRSHVASGVASSQADLFSIFNSMTPPSIVAQSLRYTVTHPLTVGSIFSVRLIVIFLTLVQTEYDDLSFFSFTSTDDRHENSRIAYREY